LDHLTSDVFLAWFPQFTAVDPVWVDGLLDQCQTAAFDPCVWGPWLQWGEALWVAHWLTLREMWFGGWDVDNPQADLWMRGVIQTGVSSFSAGSVSWSKDTSLLDEQAKNPYMRTLFGQEFYAMQAKLAVGLVMVT
jgi:Protein of unknown function (DUF4054)